MRASPAQHLFVQAAPAITVLALTLFAPRLAMDGDHFLHIAAGQWMLDHHSVLRSDPFSYTFAGTRWNAHEWLSQIVMAAVYRIGGWSGLYLLFGLAFAATAWLLARQLLKVLNPVPALYMTVLSLAILKEWVTLRPHVLAMPLLALWAAEVMDARREGRAPHWFLIPLMMLWANLHGSFLAGIALLLPFTADAIFAAAPDGRVRTALRWGAVLFGSILAATLNPNGISGLLFPLAFVSDFATSLTPEFGSASLGTFAPIEIFLMAVLFSVLFLGVRVSPLPLLVLIGMLHAALAHQRFAVILAIVAPMLLAEPIASALNGRGWPKRAETGSAPRHSLVFTALAAAAVGLLGLIYPRAVPNDELSPSSALSSVPAEIRGQPVLNDWMLGGYLIFRGVRPFVDTRLELYGYDFLNQYRSIEAGDRGAIESAVAKYGVRWAILAPGSGANAVLDEMPGWCTFYADSFAVVHVGEKTLCEQRLVSAGETL